MPAPPGAGIVASGPAVGERAPAVHTWGVRDSWTPSSWRSREARHQPEWPDPGALEQALKALAQLPPLVFAGEARALTRHLGAVARGEAFLLQAGDCAESFDSSADSIRDKLRVILQMAVVLTYSGGMPVVKVGRIAGQFAKPRSRPTEVRDDVELPSFLGHIVNDIGFTEAERAPDPDRLLTAYHRAASTLNLLRAFTRGGFADLSQVSSWNREFVASSPAGQRYAQMAGEIDRALRFMTACGVTSDTTPQLHEVEFFTSHEALLLGYEEALTRLDSLTGEWYDCSAHMLWIGERTRQVDGAHVEFLRGVRNPIGCKVGPTATADEVLELCERLNPDREPGRLTLITRMGAERVRELLPPLLAAVRDAGHPVVWACDPMHGNTFTSESGLKTRHFDDVLDEIAGFFAAHAAEGTIPGGVHVELTGDAVTECLGGSDALAPTDLESRYETMCDPRLNARQSVDLAFRVAELLRSRT
ncbi:MAG: 3-deoxy-7-phosphoheptulonate synthase class II [Actinomyces sp.]|nr:MAG: 3-deoxy-7-phosphoheptulonate synthase class II [Actinomyces sp.]